MNEVNALITRRPQVQVLPQLNKKLQLPDWSFFCFKQHLAGLEV